MTKSLCGHDDTATTGRGCLDRRKNVRRLRLARMTEERGPCGIWTDRNAQGEDRKENQTVPLRIRSRGKRPVNHIGKSFTTWIRQDFGIRIGMR